MLGLSEVHWLPPRVSPSCSTVNDRGSPVQSVATIPEAFWEWSFGIYLKLTRTLSAGWDRHPQETR
jgi:hypothetical protein